MHRVSRQRSRCKNTILGDREDIRPSKVNLSLLEVAEKRKAKPTRRTTGHLCSTPHLEMAFYTNDYQRCQVDVLSLLVLCDWLVQGSWGIFFTLTYSFNTSTLLPNNGVSTCQETIIKRVCQPYYLRLGLIALGQASLISWAFNSCQRCRRQKIKCSGTQPCDTCSKRKQSCTFDNREQKILVTRG